MRKTSSHTRACIHSPHTLYIYACPGPQSLRSRSGLPQAHRSSLGKGRLRQYSLLNSPSLWAKLFFIKVTFDPRSHALIFSLMRKAIKKKSEVHPGTCAHPRSRAKHGCGFPVTPGSPLPSSVQRGPTSWVLIPPSLLSGWRVNATGLCPRGSRF